jgi:CDP-diacylglycerol---glycerol-3-phosphate 3-phosphatidyltransferase
MNFPNTLTLIRIFLVPVLVVVLWTRYPNWEIIGVAVFLSAAFTDWLDGYWARRKGQITAFGTYLDPVADKLLTAAAFIALVDMQLAPAWIVAVIITREVGVTGLRNLALMRGFTVRVNDVGKAKMGVQVFAITALILGERMPLLNALGTIALWLAMALALISGLQYLRSFWRQASAHAAAEADLPSPALERFSPASSLSSSAASEHAGGSAGAASLDKRPAL